MIKEWFQKVMDLIMPWEPMPEEEPEKKVEAPQPAEAKVEEVAQVRRAAAGGGAVYAGSPRRITYASKNSSQANTSNFAMKIYKPADYNQVSGITDDILTQKAVVVNYENVNVEEQQRICDFIDGACYAVDGTATKISDRIYLYAPPGIDADDLAELIAETSARHR